MDVSGQYHMPQVFYPQYPPKKRLNGSQSWFGCFGEEKHPLALLGTEPHIVSHYADYIILVLM